MKALHQQKCLPCQNGIALLTKQEIAKHFSEVKSWAIVDQKKLEKTFVFENFKKSIIFVNQVAKLAEQEGHHPDILIYGWSKVVLTLKTYVAKGLTINDFVLASKIDQI